MKLALVQQHASRNKKDNLERGLSALEQAVEQGADVIAYAEFGNMDMLRGIIDRLGSLNGVQRTQTAVAIPPRLE